ncbi:MAG: sulfatase-like hydrolase/transferase [Chitinophagaceae bacterium]|nr:sulfatase-like hydrolase/transferase [Chitinophagaceae bacterium]
MSILNRVPRLLKWTFAIMISFLVIMTLSRFIIFWRFNPPGKAFSGSAFIMGLRYDARVIAVLGLVILLLCSIPFINPFRNAGAKKWWNFLVPFLFIFLIVVLTADYYHFDYLHQRLNATVLNYVEDAGISFNMMWQSYPLIKISIGLIILSLLARFYFGRLLSKRLQQQPIPARRTWILYLITVLLLGGTVFGKFGQFPLRWSDAYTLSDDFKANLALNPFQSFISTLSFRNATYDIKKVKAGYPMMADYLGVDQPDSNRLNYERAYQPSSSPAKPPNVVIVICESFSAYKSSMFNNPLKTTPYFDELCRNGVFFNRCFTPAYGTARGVWATITGIPDVASPRTASRNPNAVDQHTIINDFKDYEHFYFLGGSATWANIRGLLTNNISGLHLYEQDSYKARKVDVWGISDKNLLLEANGVLKKQDKPFFAIIQTADNHRPYTIPAEDRESFTLITYSSDSLRRFGFESNEEMNAFRYTDYCYRQYMEAAKKEAYFNNTLFVFVGDHGIRYNGTLEHFPKSWTEQGLTCEHVPLLFYAPDLLAPKKVETVCSQLDILPSVARLAGIPYRNTGFGRDLFDTANKIKEGYAFIIDHDVKTIGLAGNEYYFLKNLKTGKEELVSMKNNEPVPVNPETEMTKGVLSKLTDACYETAKYMLLNNKKKN